MPTIIVPANVAPCQVEVPETIREGDQTRKSERSTVVKTRSGNRVEEPRKGSLHIRPARTMDLTDDEWAAFQKAQPALAKRCIVVKQQPKAKAKASPPASMKKEEPKKPKAASDSLSLGGSKPAEEEKKPK